MGNNSLIEPHYQKFEVEASQCELRIGTKVTPETVVGRDYETNELIKAGTYGRVTTVHFNPAHHSLLITVAVGEA